MATKAIAQVGDPVSYKLTVYAKPGAENYVVTDTLSDGLTSPLASAVSVPSGDGTYSVDVTGQVITVTFTKAYLDTITENAEITIEYTATLNSDAVVGEEGNLNTVKLTWGHSDDEDVNYSEDDSKVYTAQVGVLKTDGGGNALEGAGFVVMNSEDKYYALDDDGNVTWVANIADADEHFSAEDGTVSPFTGLKSGDYTLVEKSVPDGYNKLDDTTFSIADTNYTNESLMKSETVENNAGSVLPSTGGIGTTILYIIGAVLVIGAGVFLVTKRRMRKEDSIEE